MCNCLTDCPREDVSCGVPSPGPIRTSERLVRGVYDDMHYKNRRTSIIKKSVIRSRDLFCGELSVWRSDAVEGFAEQEVLAVLSKYAPLNNTLGHAVVLQVEKVRSFLSHNKRRAYCAIDDTICGADGQRHAAHAAIGICAEIRHEIVDEKDPKFIIYKDQLINYIQAQIEDKNFLAIT